MIIIRTLFILLSFILLSACNQTEGEANLAPKKKISKVVIKGIWTPVGMGGGGGIELPSISPHDKNTVFLSTDMSGVYKTENFGTNWSVLPFRTVDQNGITDRGGSSPIQFTNDPKIIYANHRDTFPADFDDIDSPSHIRYVVKSSDGGKTFHKLKSPDAAVSAQVYADPNSSERLIINAEVMNGNDSEMRILYSGNGGDTFFDTSIRATQQGDDYVLLLSGVVWFETNNMVEVVISTNSGLYVSKSRKMFPPTFRKVKTNKIKGSIATFTHAKESNGKSRLFAVTYPDKLGWNLQYPRTPTQMLNSPDGEIKPENVHVYRMDWELFAKEQTWQELPFPRKEVLPFWVRTSRNDIDTVYLAGVDKSPWTRPSVIKDTQGGLGHWQSVFLTDEHQGNSKDANYVGNNWIPKKPNQNIQSGWAATDGVYEGVDGIIEMSWNWSPNAEGFAVDPNNSARLMLSTNSLHVSEDGGKQWRQAYNQQDTQNSEGKAIPKHESKKRYKSNGLEPTVSWWMEWLEAEADSTLIVGQTDVKGMLSHDSGESWRSLANILANENTYKITKSIDKKYLYAATASPNDIYLDHYRLRDLENETAGIDSCLADKKSTEFMGTVSRSDSKGDQWEILQKFNCPVVWVEVDKTKLDKIYASVVHGKFGGIYVSDNAREKSPIFKQLAPNPESVSGNPNTIISLGNGDLLTSWSVRFDANTGKPVGSGIYRWITSDKKWKSINQPKAMDIWTRDLVLHPDDSSTWFATSYNRYNKFSKKLNSIESGGGGLFRFTKDGSQYQRITPDSLYRVDSISINPKNTNEAYLTTESEGLWKTSNLNDEKPLFTRVKAFPYGHTIRAFYSPQGRVWVTTFGGGLFRLD